MRVYMYIYERARVAMAPVRRHRLGQVSDKARSRQVCFAEGFYASRSPSAYHPRENEIKASFLRRFFPSASRYTRAD